MLESVTCTLSILLLKSVENQDRFLAAKGVRKLVTLAQSTTNDALLSQVDVKDEPSIPRLTSEIDKRCVRQPV